MGQKGFFTFNAIIKDVNARIIISYATRANALVDVAMHIFEDGSCIRRIAIFIFSNKVKQRDCVRTDSFRGHQRHLFLPA